MKEIKKKKKSNMASKEDLKKDEMINKKMSKAQLAADIKSDKKMYQSKK